MCCATTCTDRYNSYDPMRQSAVLYLEEKQDLSDPTSETAQMDVDQRLLALEKGKGKGKGKRKEKRKGGGKNKPQGKQQLREVGTPL